MRGALIGIALAALLVGVARADDDPSDPVIHGELIAKLPADQTLAIEPLDDNDDNLKLRDLMTKQLVAGHGRVSADAPLVLHFNLRVISGKDRPPEVGTGGKGVMSGGGYAPPNALPADTPIIYRLQATIEQRNGPVLWKADVMARPTGRNERQMPERLARTLIDNLGRDVDTRRPAERDLPLVPLRKRY
jgi:hypothetical protein